MGWSGSHVDHSTMTVMMILTIMCSKDGFTGIGILTAERRRVGPGIIYHCSCSDDVVVDDDETDTDVINNYE
jgi:hypothetical protein